MPRHIRRDDGEIKRRGERVRRLGRFNEMLPGSLIERERKCGRPNCHCADGKKLHPQFQLSVRMKGRRKTYNVPAQLAEEVRKRVGDRKNFEAIAAEICEINLRTFLKKSVGRTVSAVRGARNGRNTENSDGAMKCEVCGHTERDEGALKQHLKREHPEQYRQRVRRWVDETGSVGPGGH